jgi:hypothetical protein
MESDPDSKNAWDTEKPITNLGEKVFFYEESLLLTQTFETSLELNYCRFETINCTLYIFCYLCS